MTVRRIETVVAASSEEPVLARIEGRVGRLTLDRPRALNALSHEMVLAIEAALRAWEKDPAVFLVIVEGRGERAFCAGGDIEGMYRAGMRGDHGHGLAFWQDEYRLNAYIAAYPKPYVAFMHGFVMGGGVGVSAHGSHRIVCGTSQVAMPECSIGLIPDVGGTHLLARAPGRIGEFIGLTGLRMGPADAIAARFADRFVPEENFEALKAALCESGNAAEIDRFSEAPPEGRLAAIRDEIDRVFAGETVAEIVAALEEQAGPWAERALADIARAAPLSLLCTLALIRHARERDDLETALENELRFTSRASAKGEFLEGIRAAIIDKDRNPQWRYRTLPDVPADLIEEMLPPK